MVRYGTVWLTWTGWAFWVMMYKHTSMVIDVGFLCDNLYEYRCGLGTLLLRGGTAIEVLDADEITNVIHRA